MIRSDTDFLIQSGAICDRRNDVIDKVLYTYLVSCENKFADEYGEWFNVRMEELKNVIDVASKDTVLIHLNRLCYHGYIEVANLKSCNNEIVRARIRTSEERAALE